MYWLIRAVNSIVHILPLPFSLGIGTFLGRLMYCNRKRRTVALINVKGAFPYKTDKEIVQIVKRSFISFGVTIIETLLIDKLKEKVTIEWEEEPDTVDGILVGIHQGSWELYNARVAQMANLGVIVKPQKDKALDKFLYALRRGSRVGVCTNLKELVDYIKNNNPVGFMLDHGAEENARFIDFFGKLVPTPGGAVRLAKKFNKKIFPCFGYRTQGHHTFLIKKPLEVSSRSEEDILRNLNKIYEQLLEEHPWDYLWWYKRFKRKASLEVLILTDGKAGHIKQSLSLYEFLKTKKLRVKESVLQLHYKSKFRSVLAQLVALFAGRFFLGHTGWLKFFLKEEVWECLSERFFDIVISTGSKIAPINLIYARALGAKSCVILKPNVPLAKFDLVILPEHDGVRAKNVVNIKGALVRTPNLSEQAKAGKQFFKLGNQKKISLFIGNFLDNQDKFTKNLELFLKNLKKFSTKEHFRLLVTTSRRTDSSIERIVEDQLNNFTNTEALVIVSKNNWPFVVPTFLCCSDLTFVSNDSVSMISESLHAENNTVCVRLEETPRRRHLRFFNSLEGGFMNFLEYPYATFKFRKPPLSVKQKNYSAIDKALIKLL
jgi:lauroyl/myristoyl acyltransferase/mitochondrial fission protein ELM1